MWIQSRYALEFFTKYNVPFQDMVNENSRVTNNNWCLFEHSQSADCERAIVVYLRRGGTASINLSGVGRIPNINSTMSVLWYDPRNGGTLQSGSVSSLKVGSTSQSLGTAPNNSPSDWVVILRCTMGCKLQYNRYVL